MRDGASDILQETAFAPPPDTDSQSFELAILTRQALAAFPHWARAFAAERKDHRYYELVEDTIRQGFDYRYFVIKDESGEVRAVQPFFLLDQDMLAGTGGWVKAAAQSLRRLWPGFMRLRTLMVGCAAGEGHLDSASQLPQDRHVEILAAGITKHARQLGAQMVVLKEFPASDRQALEPFLGHGYTRIPSLPMTGLDLPYADFDDYMERALSRNTRSSLKRRFKASKQIATIKMSVYRDVTPFIDECYPLYLKVYERAALQFEKLTEDYLCGVGRSMPDKVRFFVWRQGDKIVAFNLCMIEGGAAVVSEYVGFDYDVAFDLSLYHIVIRDVMSWAMANGYQGYRSTALNYEPKFRLRHRLVPLDLYVRHTSPIVNFALGYILPWVEPTRYDKILPRFANYQELWATK